MSHSALQRAVCRRTAIAVLVAIVFQLGSTCACHHHNGWLRLLHLEHEHDHPWHEHDVHVSRDDAQVESTRRQHDELPQTIGARSGELEGTGQGECDCECQGRTPYLNNARSLSLTDQVFSADTELMAGYFHRAYSVLTTEPRSGTRQRCSTGFAFLDARADVLPSILRL